MWNFALTYASNIIRNGSSWNQNRTSRRHRFLPGGKIIVWRSSDNQPNDNTNQNCNKRSENSNCYNERFYRNLVGFTSYYVSIPRGIIVFVIINRENILTSWAELTKFCIRCEWCPCLSFSDDIAERISDLEPNILWSFANHIGPNFNWQIFDEFYFSGPILLPA